MEPEPGFKSSMIDKTAQPAPLPPNRSDRPKAPEKPAVVLEQPPGEQGGPKGPEPTRYGDWSHKGIVSDF